MNCCILLFTGVLNWNRNSLLAPTEVFINELVHHILDIQEDYSFRVNGRKTFPPFPDISMELVIGI